MGGLPDDFAHLFNDDFFYSCLIFYCLFTFLAFFCRPACNHGWLLCQVSNDLRRNWWTASNNTSLFFKCRANIWGVSWLSKKSRRSSSELWTGKIVVILEVRIDVQLKNTRKTNIIMSPSLAAPPVSAHSPVRRSFLELRARFPVLRSNGESRRQTPFPCCDFFRWENVEFVVRSSR